MTATGPEAGSAAEAGTGTEAEAEAGSVARTGTAARKPLFGVGVSTAIAAAAETLRRAELADRGGLDLFTVSDHPYYGARMDAYSIVGVALGRTRNISGLVSVTNVPTRPAPMLARAVTSLAALTGGRIVLGIGAGGLWDDIVRTGAPRRTPAEAVRQMEEAIVVTRMLAGGGAPVSFDGEFYQVTDLEPAPVAPVPVWTGSVGPKSLAVAGKLADGWIPGHAADWLSARYRESRPIVDEAARAAGRDPADVATVHNLPGVITDAPRATTRDADGRWVGGSAEQWIEELTGAVLEHGATGFVLFSPGGGAPDDATIERWAREVAPAVREAVSKGLVGG